MNGLSWIDWTVMLGTLFTIVAYGVWKTRGAKDIEGYLLGGKESNWWTIGLSVMATQASAITFLSTPGQAYMEGMGFVQFYFGLPLAMIVISTVFIPLYYKLKVYTAYEFLESRFDNKTRLLTASLFLLQRGLAAGITIYAPAIILSQILSIELNYTIFFIGGLVIIYTVSGGTKAVSQTHKQQMAVIFLGMFIAAGFLISYLTDNVSFSEGIQVAGIMDKMEVIDWNFDPGSRYNIWSGILGGFFLQLSYFGTDQSQVQRYLSGSSIKESRLGLMFNGLLKIPMQFFILFVGILLFLFYQFVMPPLHFNAENVEQVKQSEYALEYEALEDKQQLIFDAKKDLIFQYQKNPESEDLKVAIKAYHAEERALMKDSKALILKANPAASTEDDDYIFITFVTNFLPIGLIGLLLAVIFSAAMSSTSAELNALASTTTIDIYKRNIKQDGDDKHYLTRSKLFTFMFGILAIIFAVMADLFDNLIEAVNILGSLFYGTILGVFLVAFFFKKVKGNAVFTAALISQAIIIALYTMNRMEIIDIAYLWYNLIAPGLVIGFALVLQSTMKINTKA
ncbi:MAG: sodium:solute symporter [Flavobacteriales bacterium]|nr:sodium:solute symporter [Flavobacteriales bacterium]